MMRSFRFLRGLPWAGLLGLVLCTSSGLALPWPSEIKTIETQLASADLEQRRAAAERLRTLPPSVAHRLLESALLDTDSVVRVHSAQAAIETNYEQAATRVGAWFADNDASVRLAAARVLAAFPDRGESIARLARALGDPDARVRRAVAHALGASTDPEATPALLARLDDSDPDVAMSIVAALERLGDPRSAVPLISKLSDNRAKLRRAVVVALGTLGGSASVSALTLALRDSDAAVRLGAVTSLGRTADEGAIDGLRSVLATERELDVRVAALDALSEIPSPRATALLIDSLESPRVELATAAAELLRTSQHVDASQLIECLEGQPATLRAEGCALAIAAQRAPKAYDAITQAWRRRVIGTLAALEAYAALGDTRALTDALEQLGAPQARVRVAAVHAAANLLDVSGPDGRAVEPVVNALRAATELEERIALVDLLGRTRSPRATTALLPLTDEAVAVRLRLAALRALGRTGGVREAEAGVLLLALADPHAPVRFEAAHSIRRAGNSEMLSALFERLDTAAAQDRQAVALALAGPLSRLSAAQGGHWVKRLLKAISVSSDAAADALVEALSVVPGPAADAALAKLRRDPARRSKVAEVLSGRADLAANQASLVAELSTLLSDPSPNVRANAAWSLGQVGDSSVAPALRDAVGDSDVAVQVNALGALGRLQLGEASAELFCSMLDHPHPYARANALVALRLGKQRCAEQSELSVLERDASPVVRARAAALIRAVPSSEPDADSAALRRCARVDIDGGVAAACLTDVDLAPSGSERRTGVAIYVVPAGYHEARAGAPFALVEPDKLLRLGVADRRGAVFHTTDVPSELSLAIPAALIR